MVFCDQTQEYAVSRNLHSINCRWTALVNDREAPGDTPCRNQQIRNSADMCYSLAAVNFCLFIVGTIQVSRILAYQSSQKGSIEGGAKELGSEIKADAKKLEQQAETAGKELKQKA